MAKEKELGTHDAVPCEGGTPTQVACKFMAFTRSGECIAMSEVTSDDYSSALEEFQQDQFDKHDVVRILADFAFVPKP